jgi:phosphatidylinositol alpha-1,6-mannosyltransferase
MSEHRIGIVVLNHNRGTDLIECLQSIYSNSHRCFDVFVVDNASIDGSVELATSWAAGSPGSATPPVCAGTSPDDEVSESGPARGMRPRSYRHVTLVSAEDLEQSDADRQDGGGDGPDLTIISCRANLGFAGGHNLGIRMALGGSPDSVLLLNSDIIVDRDFLEPLLSELAGERVGAVGPAVLYYGDPGRVWQAGGEIFPSRGSARRTLAEQSTDVLGSEPAGTQYLSGCAVLFKRSALESVGLLDEDYFLYFEDTDWFARAAALGWEFRIVPRSRVRHKETTFGITAKSVSASYYFARNRLMFVKKNYPAQMASALFWSFRYGILNHLLRRRWWHLGMSLKGMWDFFGNTRGRCESASSNDLLRPSIMVFSADYKPQAGGIAEHAYKIACHLSATGARVTVLAPAFEGSAEFDSRAPFETYRVTRVPVLDVVGQLFAAFHIILCRRVSLVYCATSHPCAWICRLLRLLVFFRFTVTIHAHEVVYSSRGLRQKMKRALRPVQARWISGADRVFAVSNFTKDALVLAGVGGKKISIIFNGIDPEDFAGSSRTDTLARRYGLEGRRVILTVARLDIHKGHDVVIEAMPQIIGKVADVVYIIAGAGPTRPYLERLCEEKGVTGQVVFTGRIARADVLALFALCEVFVMISRVEGSNAEGFGIVFLEAGAFSKPVVGGNAGGVPDAIEDGETGYLVDPASPGAVAAAVTRILLDPELAARLGRQGRERSLSRFTWDRVVDRIMDGLDADR